MGEVQPIQDNLGVVVHCGVRTKRGSDTGTHWLTGKSYQWDEEQIEISGMPITGTQPQATFCISHGSESRVL